ncbi:unnamed protein product, partial [Porites evermanni]
WLLFTTVSPCNFQIVPVSAIQRNFERPAQSTTLSIEARLDLLPCVRHSGLKETNELQRRFFFPPSSRPDQLLHAGRLLRPLNQTTKPVHQTDRPPHHCRPDSRPDLRSDHQTQSPNYQSNRSGRFHQARPPKPTRLL